MEGIKINGVTMYLGKLPTRKQEAIYFNEDGRSCLAIAYINKKNIGEAKRLWQKLLDGVPN